MFESLMAMNADGIIAAPIGQVSSLDTITRLKERLPIVFVDSRFQGTFDDVDFVCTNNRQSISLMVEYLHRSGGAPVFLGMPRINSNSLEREQAYLKSAEDLGFEPTIIPVDNASTVLNFDELVWNFEEFAFRTMDEYFGSHPLSAYVFPALTTVSRNTQKMGQAAVEQILDQIGNGLRVGKGVVRTFDAELRLRESA